MADAKDGAAKQEYAPRVISGELAFLIRSALNTAIYGEQGLSWKGTSWRIAQSIKRSDIGGKTGTTNSAKVAWYAGFGANLVTTTYVGFDEMNKARIRIKVKRVAKNSNACVGRLYGSCTF